MLCLAAQNLAMLLVPNGFPGDLHKLNDLRELDLSAELAAEGSEQAAQLAPDVAKLSALTKLDLSRAGPDMKALGNLPNLQSVRLRRKELHLPASWGRLTSLHTLHIGHCPIWGHIDMLSQLTRPTGIYVDEVSECPTHLPLSGATQVMATSNVRGLEQALSGLPRLKSVRLTLHAHHEFVVESLSKLTEITNLELAVGLTSLQCCNCT